MRPHFASAVSTRLFNSALFPTLHGTAIAFEHDVDGLLAEMRRRRVVIEISLTSSVSDPGTLDTFTYAWTVTKNGALYTASSLSSFAFTPNDDATYLVTLTVTDDDGASGSASQNVMPTLAVSAPAITVDPGDSATVTFSNLFTDPGVDDTHAFTWQATLADGSATFSGTE